MPEQGFRQEGYPGYDRSGVLWVGVAAAAVVASVVLAYGRPDPGQAPEQFATQPDLAPTSSPAALATFQFEEVVIRANDTLDAVFGRLAISRVDLARVRALPEVRRSLDLLRPGDVILLTHLDGELKTLTRSLSNTATLTIRRVADGFSADVIENPLEESPASMHGRIESSLFSAVGSAGGTDGLAVAIADVFKYDIDFINDVRAGDRFTVTWQQEFQDGKFVRDGAITAAEFVNRGKAFRAVRYIMPDGSVEYFTPEGESVRKAFLRFPVEFGRVSSGFSLARRHPILNRVTSHKGIDFAAPTGTPIKAAGSGRVQHRGTLGGYGNAIILAHPGSVTTLYAHMSRFSPGLSVGDKVTQGQVIGYVGSTGLSTGPHLHYEYRVGGVHRNPATVPMPKAESIPAELRADFQEKSARLLAELDRLERPAGIPTATTSR